MSSEHPPGYVSALGSVVYVDHVAASLCSDLAGAGIGVILLKGATFRDMLYDAGEARWYSDIDLLVDPQHGPRVEAMLEAQGFHDLYAGRDATEMSPYAKEFRGSRVIVDLHRSLPGVAVPDEVAWRILARDAVTIVLRDRPVRALSAEARCLHAVLNAATRDGAGDAAVHDLSRALDRLPDSTWRGAAALAGELEALDWLAGGLQLLPEGERKLKALQLDVDVPASVALRVSVPPPTALGLERLISSPGLMAKVRFLGRRLVPTPSGLRYWSPLARRGPLGMVLAYAYRPFYLLARAPAAGIAVRRARAATRLRTQRSQGYGPNMPAHGDNRLAATQMDD